MSATVTERVLDVRATQHPRIASTADICSQQVHRVCQRLHSLVRHLPKVSISQGGSFFRGCGAHQKTGVRAVGAVFRVVVAPADHFVQLSYTCHTEPLLRRLVRLKRRTQAVMHGSSYAGDGGRALCDLAGLVREAFDVTAG